MNLTLVSAQAMLPLLIVAASIIVVMMAIAIRRHPWWNPTFAVLGLNLAVISLYAAWKAGPQMVTPLFLVDGPGLFFVGLTLVTTLACSTLVHAYIDRYAENREEMYLLMLLAALGGMVMSLSMSLVSAFIGLEIMSVALYGLIAYTRSRRHSLEAGIKYMVLSSAASAFMLFGMALLYAEFGSLDFASIGHFNMPPERTDIVLTMAATMMLLVGFGFKLSLVPFHMWTTDVYEGSPAPVGAFLATTGKVAVMAMLLRMLIIMPAMRSPAILIALQILAVASILGGSLLALKQNNIKRMLGYSSIAHFGYVLIGMLMFWQPRTAFMVVAVYLFVYSVTAIASFGVIALMSSGGEARDADSLQDYRGLFWQRPLLSSVMTVALLSLAGIPMTAGFVGKLYIAMAGVSMGQLPLLIALFFGSAIGIYFYLRTMIALYLRAPGMRTYDADLHWGAHVGGLMVLGVAGVVLLVGVYPHALTWLIQQATTTPH